MERGTTFNSHQYNLLNRDTPSLVEPTINHLKQAVTICRDISRKMELLKIEEEAEQMEIVYLFSWDRMWNIEKHRLEEFIFNETGENVIEIPMTRPFTYNEKKFECTFSAFEKESGSLESIVVRTFSITMNDTNTGAEVLISDPDNNNVIYKKELLVKPAENNIYDFNLYTRSGKKQKRRRQTQ